MSPVDSRAPDPKAPSSGTQREPSPPHRLRICIDARSPGRGGIVTYIANLIDRMLQLEPDHDYLLLIDPDQPSRARPGVVEVRVPAGNPLQWFVWSNTRLPRLLREHRIDVYHTLKHVTAFRVPARRVATLHGAEMIYRFPRVYAWYDLLYWRIVYSMAARRYDRLLTATRCEAEFFAARKGIPHDKFRRTPFAAAARFQKITDPAQLAEARRRLGLPPRFILFVGRMHEIKNLERLVEAFAQACPRLPESVHLVLTGVAAGAYHERLTQQIARLGLGSRVQFTGAIGEDLPLLFNLADAFVLISLYENFGLVLLEAMACGAPVIASDIADIDDVVGTAAVRVPPTDVAAVSTAMVDVLSSPERRADLSARGLAQAHQFSWDRCARETLDVYRELATAVPTAVDAG
jgi:glycosyltransferase involved in cell wall biosynthesis